MSELADNLTKQERELRRRFVEQYLVDYDAFAATVRLGFSEAFATSYSKKFMLEPYTLNRISEREAELGVATEEDLHRRKIVASLYREANSRFNSGSARVAALSQLAKITGIEAPVKSVQEVHVTETSPELAHLTVEELEEIKQKMYVKTPE